MEFTSDNRGISIYTFSKITRFYKNVDIRDSIKKFHNLEQISMILLRSESSIEESIVFAELLEKFDLKMQRIIFNVSWNSAKELSKNGTFVEE